VSLRDRTLAYVRGQAEHHQNKEGLSRGVSGVAKGTSDPLRRALPVGLNQPSLWDLGAAN
jgi:hypothetical protein